MEVCAQILAFKILFNKFRDEILFSVVLEDDEDLLQALKTLDLKQCGRLLVKALSEDCDILQIYHSDEYEALGAVQKQIRLLR